MSTEQGWEVVWNEEKRVLTLEGEPVLEYALTWPEIKGAGRGGKRVSRYYGRMVQVWRQRWGRELYWDACLSLVACRERSRPFRPWKAELDGKMTCRRDDLLSFAMEAWESGGDGRPLRVSVGDIWRMPEGVPVTLREFFPGQRSWRKKVLRVLEEQGEARRAAGECFLDRDVSQKLSGLLRSGRYCLGERGLEFRFPQCQAAPAAEGCPFLIFPVEMILKRQENA